ncbi:Fringe-like [Cordylochernes scorpioides]|uniref:Fringe-like n=1 Tax=Cordylochernes scorpioides TaxID=51811 RepID=A0ABY6KA80_9ARAC|nr:Fringe-like [Cordylochernes scorpioides]
MGKNFKSIDHVRCGPPPRFPRMCGTSLKTINNIIHKDLKLDTRRKGKVHKLTPFHMKNRATNAWKLYEEHLAGSRSEYTATLDEAWMYVTYCNGIRKICYIKRGNQVPDNWVHQCSETFPKGFMVVGVMTGRGVLPLIKVPSKVKVNSEFYIECVLKPVIEQLKDLYPGEMDKVFLHHDKASSHTSNKTQQFLQEMKDTLGLNFIRNSDIPVKSPDASPLDFYGFGMRNKPLLAYFALTNGILVLAVYLILSSQPQPVRRMVRLTDAPVNVQTSSTTVTPVYVPRTLLSHYRECLEFNHDEYPSCQPGTNAIIVISAPRNKVARNVIRTTWGRDARAAGVLVRFLVGRLGVEQEDVQMLGREKTEFKDVIHSHCIDSYRNLTLKTVSLVSWLSQFCLDGGFILKTDDDVFVNVANLVRYASSCLKSNMIIGRLARGWTPHRNPKNKYFIPTSEFEQSVYPDFITGPGYLFRAELASALYNASLDMPFLRLEDVFLTGVVAQRLGVARRGSPDFRSDSRWVARRLELPQVHRAITVHKNSPQRMHWLFKATRSLNTS